MKKNKFVLFLAFMFLCCSINVPKAFAATGALSIISSSPSQNATAVKINSAIIVKFSKAIKKGSKFSSIKLATKTGNIVASSLQISGSTLTITPKAPLKYATAYTLTIAKNSIVDAAKKTLGKDYVLNFKTAAKAVVPTVPTVITPTPQPAPGSDGNHPPVAKKKLFLHSFYSGFTSYNQTTEAYLKTLDAVSFAWLKLDNSGGNVLLKTDTPAHDFRVPADYAKPLSFCKTNNIPSYICIFSDGNMAKAIIADATSRKQLIDKLLIAMTMPLEDGTNFEFSGITIDFEGFRQADTSAYFNTFLKELRDVLTPLNKTLYIAVNVRRNYGGYDYKTILQYTDKVILMAHDYEPATPLLKSDINKYTNYNPQNPINSMAPINSVKTDLEDLISSISSQKDMDKILLQFSFGASQWQFPIPAGSSFDKLDNNAQGTREMPSYKLLMDRLYNKDDLGQNIYNGYVKELESPYLSYYNSSTKKFNFIIYEDSRSIKAKITLCKLENIGGISLWRLGSIPDYNDEAAKKYYFDVWNNIVENLD